MQRHHVLQEVPGLHVTASQKGVGGHTAQCFPCSHPPSLRLRLLIWVRGRLLSKLGLAPTWQSRFYIPMIVNSHRGFGPLLFKAALSQVGRHEETTGQAQAKISITYSKELTIASKTGPVSAGAPPRGDLEQMHTSDQAQVYAFCSSLGSHWTRSTNMQSGQNLIKVIRMTDLDQRAGKCWIY